VAWTADWYRALWSGDNVATMTCRQIDAFFERLEQAIGDREQRRETT
jgi:hypothetical protein